MCNPQNTKGIICEQDQEKIEDFISSLYFEMYNIQYQEDLNSNSVAILAINNGKEERIKAKSIWLGTYKAQISNFMHLE